MTTDASAAAPGVTTKIDRDAVSASAIVNATPEQIFDFVRQPRNHAIISGDETVRDNISGPERLAEGSKFGMKMRVVVPYRVTSHVKEYEEDRRIAWAHLGGHRWRWELEPGADGTTTVTETFDMSTAVFPPGLRLAGYPKRHAPNVTRSVANLRDHFA
ncbi:MAG: SRPBCC family protein [Acidimicrobiia bacterium]|jgi:hypothetical protein|nr:SRPBCC family protein [Acidimicrobiia bacterium]MBA3801998.1 SRPBCC family protein [Acidimicrobiia bacterium]